MSDPETPEGGETLGEVVPPPSGPHHYRNGRAFERRVRSDLYDNGYRCVILSAGSKTKIDAVAIAPGRLLLIQCKLTGVISAAEWNELYELAGMARAVPVLAVGGRGQRYWQLTAPKTKRGHRPMVPYPIARGTDET